MSENFHIIQAEFFHVGGPKIEGFGDLFEEINGRMLYGAPIKTCVRFFDDTGFVTCVVTELAQLEKQNEELVTAFFEATGWRRKILSFRSGMLLRKVMAMEAQRKEIASKYLAVAAKASRPIAVEIHDHSYRPARRDEIVDLCQATLMTKNAWLFVYEPNDLLADKNKIVAQSSL